jgi:hypothetical protein
MNKELKKGLRLLKQAERLHPFKPDEGKAKIYDMPTLAELLRDQYVVHDAEYKEARTKCLALLEKEQ